jgi:hypothetical protein
MLHKRLNQRGAAVNCNILTSLLLEFGDFRDDIRFDNVS